MYFYVRQFVRDLVATQFQHLHKLNGTHLLSEYCHTWRDSMTFVKFMKRVLHHLHRFWIPGNENTVKEDPVRPLDKLLMFYWREDLLSRLHNVITIALELVNEDRRGVAIDHTVVRGVVDTLVEIGQADVVEDKPDASSYSRSDNTPKQDLNLYIRVFEDDFLSLTRTFYKAEGERMVAVGDVTKFMKNVLTRLEEESERGKRFLHSDSGPRLRQATEEQLIGNHKEYLQREATEMIKAGREEDLKHLYELLSRVENGLNPLRTFFVGYVRAEGNAVVVEHIDKMAGKDDMRSNLGLVRVLITLYRKHASLIKRCFNGSQVIMLGIDDAFRGFANRSLGAVSLPNLIAHYVDHLLRLSSSFDRPMWYDEVEEKKAEYLARNNPIVKEGLKHAAIGNVIALPPSKRPRMQQATAFSPNKSVAENDRDSSDDEDGLSRYMTELVRLFMYLDDKDLFFETHRRLFAKRLLASHDEDMEMRFISKVKVQMGPTYTQRLSGMLKDKVVSNTMRAEFIQFLDKKRKKYRESTTNLNKKHTASERGTTCLLRLQQSTAEKDENKAVGSKGDPASVLNNDTLPPIEPSDPERTEPRRGLSISALVEGPRVSGWLRGSSQPHANNENQKDKSEESKKGDDEKTVTYSHIELGEALRVGFNAHVLNALHWPSVKVADLQVPTVLKTCQALFSEFYMKDKETRKLSWIHTMSTVYLGATLCRRNYSLVVSTFQACALLLLNERDEITVREACEELNIGRSELQEHLNPLLLGRKCKILRLVKKPASGRENHKKMEESDTEGNGERFGATKSPEGDGSGEATVVERRDGADANIELGKSDEAGSGSVPVAKESSDDVLDDEKRDTNSKQDDGLQVDQQMEIEKVEEEKPVKQSEGFVDGAEGTGSEEDDGLSNGDIIRVNMEFKSKLYRIVVPASVAKLASADAAVSKRNVVVDRSTQVDATLVRIMKAKKEIRHAALTSEVISALAPMFIPDPRLIKVRLERLIDQEYVERDAEDARLYRYSA